jgi:hypothetical protein
MAAFAPGPTLPPAPAPDVAPAPLPGVPAPGAPVSPDAALAAPGAAPALPAPIPAPPQPAADPFLVESLVAAVGIAPFVSRTIRRIWLYHVDRAAKLPEEIDRKLYAFINRDAPEPSAPLPPWDFEAVRADLETMPTEQHTVDIQSAFGADDLADAGVAAIPAYEKVQTYLVGKIPHRFHKSIAGPIQEKPAHSDVARFRRQWHVACDPMSVLDALNEYNLSRDMVAGLQQMYPLLYKRIVIGVTAQLHRKLGVEPKFRLSVRKEYLLRILIQDEDDNSLALGRALQKQYAAQAAAMAAKPVAKPKAKTPPGASESSAADRIGF